MKAILINPFDKTVTEVEYNGKFEQAYRLMDCEMIQFAHPVLKHTLMVDEEGLYKANQQKFRFKGMHQAYVGCALLTGGKAGNKEPTMSLQSVQDIVQFI